MEEGTTTISNERYLELVDKERKLGKLYKKLINKDYIITTIDSQNIISISKDKVIEELRNKCIENTGNINHKEKELSLLREEFSLLRSDANKIPNKIWIKYTQENKKEIK